MLYDAALRHLGRYATSRQGLARVLDRRIGRWARRATAEDLDEEQVGTLAAQARSAIAAVLTRLAAQGLIDDAAFSAQRVRSLQRSGRSSRAIAAHLAQRGISAQLLRDALPDDEQAELEAAILFARRRRLGPFRKPDRDEDRARILGAFARAGFPARIVRAVLELPADEAEDMVLRVRQRL